MRATTLMKAIDEIPWLREGGETVAHRLHALVEGGGAPGRKVADLLHGTWLGHPLHPALTDIPIGAWSLAALFDGAAAATGSREAEQIAETLTGVGVVAAVPTALTGLTDYSTIPHDALAHGALHGLLNATALAFYLLSWRARRADDAGQGRLLGLLGYGCVMAAAWLGGELVFHQRVGVNHVEAVRAPEGWSAVLDAADLPERTPKRVEVDGEPVLLYRMDGTIHAIGAVCRHAGGPLDEGEFEGYCVTCPWHDSVFDLRDGRVVHGPSTYAQPKYATRTRDGKIELRLQRG